MAIEFLDPTNSPADATALAPRTRQSLHGAKIGVIWNGRANGDRLLTQILDRISQRTGATVSDFEKKPLIGNMAPQEIFQGMVTSPVDFVLAGVGD